MSRWVRVEISVFEHPLFDGEPFSEREAWLWMISKAAWKDTSHRIGSEVEKVQAGSFFASIRHMQACWGWKSKTRVTAFLKMLKGQDMIRYTADKGKTHVTICNYSRYQSVKGVGKTEEGQGEDSGKTQKTPDLPETPISSSLRSEETRAGDFEIFWDVYPNQVGEAAARIAFSKATKRAGLEEIVAGARAYAAKEDDRHWCNPVKWLSEDRWKDRPAQPPNRALHASLQGLPQGPLHKPPDKSLHKPREWRAPMSVGLSHLSSAKSREEYLRSELERSARSFR